MLTTLHVENYVLVEKLHLEFGENFSVITGETGAGKSVLMGAIALILGQRADMKVIKEGCDRCLLEATFTQIADLKPFFEENDLEYDASLCVIRRELYASGRSRAFVNDSPVSLKQLKELGNRLVDVHSQHENLLLASDAFQLDVLDEVAKTQEERARFQADYRRLIHCRQQLHDLETTLAKQREERDYIDFQYRRLADAQLVDGEMELLEAEQEQLSHIEEIKTCLMQIEALLSGEEQGVCVSLKTALQTARRNESLYARLQEAGQRLESCLLELNDLQREVEHWNESLEINPQRLMQVEERIGLLFELMQKHRCASVGELIAQRDAYAKELNSIEQGDEALSQLQQALKEAQQQAEASALALSKKRRSILTSMKDYMEQRLRPLGMPHAVFEVECLEKAMDASGIDKVAYLFSANKNVAPQAIAQIASGGEISRLMLCLKSLTANANACSTLLFDEIDTGVSGEVADKMACLMQDIASDRQVICITHLPQIAAKGNRHYKVYKSEEGDSAISNARLLGEDERVNELARMLSGSALSREAIDNARRLIYGKLDN